MNDEMKDLAAWMAADEAGEGNYAAAAELQSFAAGPGITDSGDDVVLVNSLVAVPVELVDEDRPPMEGLAPTGPLTPGQVLCRVCQLDDRTRPASSPDDLLCNVCRAATPIRVEKARRTELGAAAERFFGLRDLEDDETAAGNMERDLRGERVDALMKLADLLRGHPVPEELVIAAQTGIRGTEADRG